MPTQVVNNSIYDTEGAKVIAAWRNMHISHSGNPDNRFYGIHANRGTDVELYRSLNATWFFCEIERGLFRRKYRAFCPADAENVYHVLHADNRIELLKEFFPDRLREA